MCCHCTGSFLLYAEAGTDAHVIYTFYKLESFSTLELSRHYALNYAASTKFAFEYIILVVTVGQISFFVTVVWLFVYYWWLHQGVWQVGVSVVIWLVLHIIAVRTLGCLMLSSFFFTYILYKYLQLRYREINDSIYHIIHLCEYFIEIVIIKIKFDNN